MKHKHVDVYLSQSTYVIFLYIYSKHTVVIINIILKLKYIDSLTLFLA